MTFKWKRAKQSKTGVKKVSCQYFHLKLKVLFILRIIKHKTFCCINWEENIFLQQKCNFACIFAFFKVRILFSVKCSERKTSKYNHSATNERYVSVNRRKSSVKSFKMGKSNWGKMKMFFIFFFTLQPRNIFKMKNYRFCLDHDY